MTKPLVIGKLDCPETYQLCDWMTRQGLDFDYAEKAESDSFPTPKLVANGSEVSGCRLGQAAALMGCQIRPKEIAYDLAIIGGGPAGLSAAIHAAAEGLRTILFEAYAFGGQASSSQWVENYAGFPNGILGRELCQNMVKQAERLGAELIPAKRVTKLFHGEKLWRLTLDDDTQTWASTVIVSTGLSFRELDECGKEYHHTGVYYGMTDRDVKECGNQVIVVGGGNSAGQAAIAFAAEGKSVRMIVRGSSLRDTMSKYLIDSLAQIPSIVVIHNAEITKTEGASGRLNAVEIKRQIFGQEQRETFACDGLFVFVGAKPEAEWLKPWIVLDEQGFISDDYPFLGLFVAGDVRSGSTKRIAIASAEGAEAVTKAWKFLHSGPCTGETCNLHSK
jgi:thioredoxin reductase (NADPH)